MVQLIGALSNHIEKLERLIEMRDRLLEQARTVEGTPKPAQQRRNGSLVGAIREIMAETRRMNVAEVHALVEERLGGPVSQDSVNSCLSTDPEFARVKRGWYRAL